MLTQIAWSDPESYSNSRNQLGFNQPTVCLFEARSNGNLCKYFVRLPWFLYILNWQGSNNKDVYIRCCNIESPRALLCSFSRVFHRWDFTLEMFFVFRLCLPWTLMQNKTEWTHVSSHSVLDKRLKSAFVGSQLWTLDEKIQQTKRLFMSTHPNVSV